MQYDLIIIGAGPGGYVAAIRGAQLGKKVALIEKHALGGTCLNRGCIPTKALVAATDTLRKMRVANRFGIDVKDYTVDFGKMMDYKNKTVARLQKGIEMLLKTNKVDVIRGSGMLLDSNTVQIQKDDGRSVHKDYKNYEEVVITASYIIIATGSTAKIYPQMNFDGERILTSTEILDLDKIPERLVIAGGGVVGCEFAAIYRELGTKVTIVELMERILPSEDEEISKELSRYFRKIGIEIMTGITIDSIKRKDELVITEPSNGKVIESDYALLSTGREPSVGGIGLENAGVKLNNNAIDVKDDLNTNVPSIYAIGDVTGKNMLAHVASAQGLAAVENIFIEKAEIDYTAIPSCVYSYPEVGTVGLTESKAAEKGINAKTGKFFFRANGKALTMNEFEGFVKIVADEKNHHIIGAQMIGPHATELIHEMVLAVRNRLSVEDVLSTVHAHPTLSESIYESVEDVVGKAIHK